MPKRDLHPITVVQDRYSGAYAGGEWPAIARSDKLENGAYRIVRCGENGPYGDDSEAGLFWSDPPAWIASGHLPDKAIKNLREQQTK